MSTEFQVTVDCADPAALAAFWAEVLNYRIESPPAGFDSWPAALSAWGVPAERWNSRSAIIPVDGSGPRLFFQQVPEGKTGKNRLHLDIRAAPGLRGEQRMAALEVEATRLEGLGATRAYRVDPEEGGFESGFITMRDPEGNELCLD
ncbi:MAG: VOC family protein [Nakamurella sp.]